MQWACKNGEDRHRPVHVHPRNEWRHDSPDASVGWHSSTSCGHPGVTAAAIRAGGSRIALRRGSDGPWVRSGPNATAASGDRPRTPCGAPLRVVGRSWRAQPGIRSPIVDAPLIRQEMIRGHRCRPHGRMARVGGPASFAPPQWQYNNLLPRLTVAAHWMPDTGSPQNVQPYCRKNFPGAPIGRAFHHSRVSTFLGRQSAAPTWLRCPSGWSLCVHNSLANGQRASGIAGRFETDDPRRSVPRIVRHPVWPTPR